ncbi:MAG: 6-phosphogluconolactonase [Cellvibrionales bacterium]|jgi:6-phosphogluconolactonase|nr:6-phosphogluconolactonase [Cellvibrionales bacterium]MBT6579373.1 6-phosphogluconolactonase [Cellvibrionales bacterium]
MSSLQAIEQIIAQHTQLHFDNRAALEAALTQSIVEQLSQAIIDDGKASIAVSGGSTPKALFAALSQTDIDWSKVDVTLVDERWVETDSDQSNERMLRECFLINHAAAANFIGMKSAHDDVADGVIDYNKQLATQIKQPFDVVILGMGGDGHTASWFPDAPEIDCALDATGNSSTLSTLPPSQPMPRITLSYPCVAAAKQLYLHITGDDKLQVLENGLSTNDALPIHRTLSQLEQAVNIYWAS